MSETRALATVSGAPGGPASPYTLVCDYGSLWTKATLFGVVAGAPRLLTTCAVPTPTGPNGDPDLRAATEHAGQRLRSLTGIPALPSEEGDGEAPGISLLPVGSAADPLDIVLIAPDRAAARRMATLLEAASYISSIRSGTVADLLAGGVPPTGYRAGVVLLVEGGKGFAGRDSQALAQLLARTGADTRLIPVLHCLPDGAHSAVSGVLSRTDSRELRVDLLGKPPRGVTVLRRLLDRLYSERSLASSGPALGPLAPQTRYLSATGSQAISAMYMAGAQPGSVLVLDAGSFHVSACYAGGRTADGAPDNRARSGAGEEPRTGVRSGYGLGGGAAALYERAGEKNLRRWLPFDPRPNELRGWAMNRPINPLALPLTLREALVEQAFVREALLAAISEVPLDGPPDILVGAGALARGMKPQVAALLLLDVLGVAFPSWQRVELLVDTANALAAVGALATVDPESAARVWEHDAPRRVATALAARGVRPGAPAVSVTLGGRAAAGTPVPGGRVQLVQAPYGGALHLELSAMRGVQLGGQQKGAPLILELIPSEADPLPRLLLDTRSAVPVTGESRAALIAESLVGSGAYAAREVEAL